MAKVKICGITRPEDIRAVNEIRPDYIGFVFAPSRRRIDFDRAAELKAALNPDTKAVGVFVNEAIESIASLVRNNMIDAVQLHGYEDEPYITRLKGLVGVPVIQAVRVRCSEQISFFSRMPSDYLLLDSYVRGERGGSGKSFDWGIIPAVKKPVFLAGGLDAGNVLEAISQVHPYCVDVSSGVETNGFKDYNKMAEFVNLVRSVR